MQCGIQKKLSISLTLLSNLSKAERNWNNFSHYSPLRLCLHGKKSMFSHWISYLAWIRHIVHTLYPIFTYMIPCLSSAETLLLSVHKTEMQRSLLWLTRLDESYYFHDKGTEWIKVPFSSRIALPERTAGTNNAKAKIEPGGWAGILLS